MTKSTNNQPLYLKVRNLLKAKIDSSSLKPGQQIPTETELIQEYGVSSITIKHALKLMVEDGLIYRVAGKGTFVSGSPLPGSETPGSLIRMRKVGFIGPLAYDEFTASLLRSIESMCKEQNLLLLIRCAANQKEEKESIAVMLSNEVEGLIIFPVDGEVYSESILALKADNFPFVLIDRYLTGIKTNAVTSDNFTGGIIGTEYLIAKGHRKIGIVSGTKSKTTSSEDRFEGYLHQIRESGLEINPNQWLTHIDEVTDIDEDKTMKLIYDWLLPQPDITAIFALSRIMSIYTAKVAARLNRKVPEDLAILAFDTPYVQDLNGFFFSHIKQQTDRIGAGAVMLLVQAIHNPAVIEHLKMPTALVEGRST